MDQGDDSCGGSRCSQLPASSYGHSQQRVGIHRGRYLFLLLCCDVLTAMPTADVLGLLLCCASCLVASVHMHDAVVEHSFLIKHQNCDRQAISG